MTARQRLVVGATGAALAVAMGAFGAHGLASRVAAEALEWWLTAARYLMYAALGVVATGLADRALEGRALRLAAGLLAGGGALSAGSRALMAVGGPRWLGAVTPLGGLAMIGGFVAFGIAAARR